MNKENCCYANCFKCPFPDCINDELFDSERKEQNEHDREILYYRKDNKGKADYLNLKKYLQSDKGKETLRRYAASEKGKEKTKRYLQSDKGKQMLERKYKKKIESGKNAEYCKRYYQKKKAERLLNINS